MEWFSPVRMAFTGLTGKQASSDRAAILHVQVLGGYGKFLVHVLDTVTPLLLSRPSMARLGLVIDVSEWYVWSKLSNQTFVCQGKGYFKIPLEGLEPPAPLQTKDGALTPGWFLEVLAVSENSEKKLREMETCFRTMLVKLNHVSKSRLENFFLLSHPRRDKQILRKFVDGFKCECEHRNRAPRRPIISLPIDPEFDAEVAMDLLLVHRAVLLHIMCLFTHLSPSSMLRRKTAQEVEDKVTANWLSKYGAPRRILTDCVGEFVNARFRSLGSLLGIKLDIVAAGAHWAIGLMERQTGTLRNLIVWSE